MQLSGHFPSNNQQYNPSSSFSSSTTSSNSFNSSEYMSRLNKYDDETPLLEELGIDFTYIKDRTLNILIPFSPIKHIDNSHVDLGGPLIFFITLGICLLLTGKLHFGYIFGFGTIGCILIYFLLKLMTNDSVTFDLICSILGYSLLPIVFIAFLNIFLNLATTTIGLSFSLLSVIWCTYTATRYIEAAFELVDQRYLIGYPVGLFYICFALISVFCYGLSD